MKRPLRILITCTLLGMLAISRTADAATTSVVVSIARQKLYLLDGSRVVAQYPVSTSRFGIGNRMNSQRTPLGRHIIAEKIGAGTPSGSIFIERKDTGKIALVNPSRVPSKEDAITSRILWLRGIERSFNSGWPVDSYRRCIYIHGTPDEGLIGRPASHGCVRMRNKDVIELFGKVSEGTVVVISR